jgi:DNA polymerase-3 subunit alpha (Gram-positive type)
LELVYISGLSHGTNVWLGNAQELINKKTATLKEVISTRDDIMEYLIRKGLEKGLAFSIMESVRRGRGLTPEFEKAMKEHKVPEWYIESCKKIKYMFPKAHAVAYTIMSFRIAYIKIHHPEHFYADYLNRDIGGFEYEFMAMDLEAVKKRLRESRFMKDADKKEKDRFKVLEVLVEMKDRGYIFSKVDLYKSHPTRFTVKDGKILPPLIAVPGLGEKVAVSVSIERNKSQFTSVEDLVKRTKVNKSVVEFMKLNNLAGSLPDSDQAVLF